MNIYVGNLSFEATDDDLRQAFEAFGKVESAQVIRDKVSGRSRGFGFVEMPEKAEAMAAIEGLNETELQGRNLRVNEARPRDDRGGGGRGGRRGGRRQGGGRRDYNDRDY
jgi:RNA recognition motif-containing protein